MPSGEPISLRLEGRATIEGRQVVRAGRAGRRHDAGVRLPPSRSRPGAARRRPRGRRRARERPGATRFLEVPTLKIPVGGAARVRLPTPRSRALRRQDPAGAERPARGHRAAGPVLGPAGAGARLRGGRLQGQAGAAREPDRQRQRRARAVAGRQGAEEPRPRPARHAARDPVRDRRELASPRRPRPGLVRTAAAHPRAAYEGPRCGW